MNRTEPTNSESRGAERVAGIILAIVLVACGAALAFRYGPSPRAQADDGPAAPPEAASTARESAGSVGGNISTPFDELGLANMRTASGLSDRDASQVLDAVAATYVARGFVRGDLGIESTATVKGSGTGATPVPRAFYFRSECPIAMIVGIGRNANPADESGAMERDLAAYVTIATPRPGGGSNWSTYRYDRTTAEALAKVQLKDANGEFPGVDPPGLPRIPGSRRVLAMPRLSGSGTIAMYEVRAPLSEVQDYYALEMERRSWKLDPYQMIGVPGTGALIYTLGDQSCTLWIQQYGGDANRVGIVIASR